MTNVLISRGHLFPMGVTGNGLVNCIILFDPIFVFPIDRSCNRIQPAKLVPTDDMLELEKIVTLSGIVRSHGV
jgi:hypothetical protein